jgi:hypothetical protein
MRAACEHANVPFDGASAHALEKAEASTDADDDGAGDGEHAPPRIAADGVFEMCGCVDCADDRGVHKSGHGYAAQTIVTKDGRRYRTLRGATPSDVPGESSRWELIDGARGAAESQQRTAMPTKPKLPQGWKGLAELIIGTLRDWANETFARAGQIEVLERRLAELETKSGAGGDPRAWAANSLADCYRGVFQDNATYARGELTTYGGSMWIALADNSERPGTGGGWQLCVKHGRDAR